MVGEAEGRRWQNRPMRLRRWTCLLLSVALAGCASRALDAISDPSDPAQFVAWTCDAMALELERVQQRAADVAYAADPRRGNDVVALGLGVTVFWTALFAMRRVCSPSRAGGRGVLSPVWKSADHSPA